MTTVVRGSNSFLRHAGVSKERSAVGQLSDDQLEDLCGYKEDERQFEADRLARDKEGDERRMNLLSSGVPLNNLDLDGLDFDAMYAGVDGPCRMRAGATIGFL